MALICRLDTEPPGGKPSQATSSSQKSFLFSSLKWNPASLIGGTTDAASKSHAALEVDNYFSDVIPEDDEINPLKYWRINSARFPLLSKLLWRFTRALQPPPELKEFLVLLVI